MDESLKLTTSCNSQGRTLDIVPCIECMYLLDLAFANEKCPECGFMTSSSIDPRRLALLNGAIGYFFVAISLWMAAQIFAVVVTVYGASIILLSPNVQFTNVAIWSLLAVLSICSASAAYWRTCPNVRSLWICLSLPMCAALAGAANCKYGASILYSSPLVYSPFFIPIGCLSALAAFIGFHCVCYSLFMLVRSRRAYIAHMVCIVVFVIIMALGVANWLSDSTWTSSCFFVLIALLSLFECVTGLVGLIAILQLRNAIRRVPRTRISPSS